MLLEPHSIALNRDLDGQIIKDVQYWTKVILERGKNQPLLPLSIKPDYIDNRVLVRPVIDSVPFTFKEQGGFYAFYHRDMFEGTYCIYAGMSFDDLLRRWRRFAYELCQIEINHGGHSAAAKYRDAGHGWKNIWVRYLLMEDIPFDIPKDLFGKIDESIAYALGSRYNTRIIM